MNLGMIIKFELYWKMLSNTNQILLESLKLYINYRNHSILQDLGVLLTQISY